MARRLLLTLAMLSLIASPAIAQDEEAEEIDYARTGAYVGGHLEGTWLTTDAMGPLWRESWRPDFGIDVFVGWRQSGVLALELEFEWITNHDNIAYGAWLFGPNFKFFLMQDRIQPYLLLGANGMWYKNNDIIGVEIDWAFRNGLGVDFYLTENWALNAETTFVWGVGDLWKTYYLTAGVGAVYRF
jgi:opacity protein-like surface antigen